MIINANDNKVTRMGRMDYLEDNSVKLYHAGSQLTFRFTGTYLEINVAYTNMWGKLTIGYFADGVKRSIPTVKNAWENTLCIEICDELSNNSVHEVTIYKKHAGNQMLNVISAETDGEFLQADSLPEFKIEVYGDSVSAGEVINAAGYEAKCDPEGHDSQFDDVYESFVMQTARNLNAQIHNIAQGGIGLFNGTGYFDMPKYTGMEEIYDKVCYLKNYGEPTKWDFSKYKADVVIIAIGQNDKHNGLTDKDDIDINDPAYRLKWKTAYKKFCHELYNAYGTPKFVLTTTILMHGAEWDDAIEEIKNELNAEGILAYHNVFKRNGAATPGHPRLAEHNEMAEELTEFIKANVL